MRKRGVAPLFKSRWANRAAGWAANIALGGVFLTFVAVIMPLVLPHPVDARGTAASFKEIPQRVAPIGSVLNDFPASGPIDWCIETGWFIVPRWQFTATGDVDRERLPDWKPWAAKWGDILTSLPDKSLEELPELHLSIQESGKNISIDIDVKKRRFKVFLMPDY